MPNYILSKDSKFHIKKINNEFYIRNVRLTSIILGGVFTATDPNLDFINRIGRLNSDGTLDSSFSIGTGFSSFVNSITIQSDGKILVGGLFTSYNGTSSNRIIRLNSDGTIDTSFTVGTGFDTEVKNVVVQNDGKILVGGLFTSYNGTSSNRIVRLNSDGTIDTSFTVGTGFNTEVKNVVVQNDGKILIGGSFSSYNGTSSNRIIRLNSDGTIDTSFTVGTGFCCFAPVEKILIQSDGKILVGGSFVSYNGTSSNRIIRLNSDGTIDTSFIVGTGFNDRVYSLAVQVDGKILVGGLFTSYNGTSINRIIRLNSDGTIDTSFTVGTGFNSYVFSIFVQSDGRILVGGWFTSYNGTSTNRIVMLNSDGTVNSEFATGAGANSNLNTLEIQSDGKILLGGWFDSYGGVVNNRIIRLNNVGAYDSDFATGIGFSSTLSTVTVQSDGKILVGGFFTSYNGTSRNRIIRLNSDGTVDDGFSIGTGFNGPVYSISVQSDGKILVVGSFTSYNGTSINRIIRLNSDGTIDSSFAIGTGFDNTVNIITIQSDGKILVGGFFTSYNGTSTNRIVRLNSDGTIDSSFAIATGFDSDVRGVVVQNDGKILVGGSFTSYNGTSINRIIRLNSDGTIDSSFAIGTGFDNTVNIITIQSDGKILVGGFFTSYNGTSTNRIVRLNSDGTIDASFTVGTGFNSGVNSITVQSDGKILIGGSFASYNGTSSNRIIRLNSDGTIDSSFNFDLNGSVLSIVYYEVQ